MVISLGFGDLWGCFLLRNFVFCGFFVLFYLVLWACLGLLEALCY